MVKFYTKWKKYNEIQLTKKQNDLNIRKMTNHPPAPYEIQITKSKRLDNRKLTNHPPSPDTIN